MNYMSKLIFLLTLMAGTMISISSSSWFGMWMGLEINLLSFIPLMINTKNLISTESAIKYFLTQSFASLIFLFTSMIYMTKFNFMFNLFSLFNEQTIINSTMLLKLGAAPFHFWLPNTMDGLSWMNSLLILTWQKLAPLMILSYSIFNWTLLPFIMISAAIGSISGLNQTSLRKLLAFSSINHLGWLITALFFSNIMWMFYYMVYFVINASIILMLKSFNIFNINQLFLFNNNSPIMKFCFLINFLSLGGLPPFLGFMPKWMIIENLIKINNLFILMFLVMMALITLFFYTRISFSGLLMQYPSTSWNKFLSNNKHMTFNLIFNMIMMLMLLILMINNYYLI